MERLALELVSDGVIFLHVSEENIFCSYLNKEAINILGNSVTPTNFLNSISSQTKFLQTARLCLQQNRELSQTLFLQNDQNSSALFKFTPFHNQSVIVLLRSPAIQFDNLQPLFQHIDGIAASIVEYHPEVQINLKVLAGTKTLMKNMQRRSEDMIGKWAKMDNLVSLEVGDALLDHALRISPQMPRIESEIVVDKPTFPERRVIAIVSNLLKKTVLFQYSVDITDLRNTKDQLVHTDEINQLLLNLFEKSDIAMGTYEIEENNIKFVLMNRAARSLLDRIPKEEDIRTVDVRKYYPIELVKLWIDKYHECMNSPTRTIHFETERGEKTYMRFLFPVSDKQMSYISLDITKMKNLERELQKHKEHLEELVKERTYQLEDALQVKGRFLATMSHELRTPIAGISGAVQLLKDTPLSQEQNEILDIANISTQQLLTVINDILDLSKLEANKMELEEISSNIHDVVEKSVEVVGFEAEKKKIDLICNVDSQVPSNIICDPTRLRQILVNLLTNAVKFSSKGSIIVSVTSSLTKNDGFYEVCFCVKDQGIGISEEAKEKMFQPFIQADSSFNRKYGGTGLGLSICKKLSERMGGRIWVESTPNVGSSFFFSILARKSDTLEPDLFENFFFRDKKILIVENNSMLLQILISLLSSCTQCSAFSSLEEAQEFLVNNKIDLILIDCNISVDLKTIESLMNTTQIAVLGYNSQLETWKQFPRIMRIRKPIGIKKLLSGFRTQSISPSSSAESRARKEDFTTQILLVEDNIVNQKIAKKFLSSLGYNNVTIVENGKLAVDNVQRHFYDIVLMDLMMPEMGGLEATKIIRSLNLKQPIIIALTADVYVSKESGFDDVLLKPMNKTQLDFVLKKYT